MTPVRIRSTAAALAAALILAACSSGGSGASVSDEGKPYAEAIAKAMTSPTGDNVPLDDDQADCLAGHFVNTIGVDRMKDAGVTPADFDVGAGPLNEEGPLADMDLSEKDANQLFDSFGKCDMNFRDVMIDSIMADEENVSPEMVTCLEGALDDDMLRAMMVSSFTGQEPDESPEAMGAAGAIMGCLFMGMGEGDLDFDGGDFEFSEDFEFDEDGFGED